MPILDEIRNDIAGAQVLADWFGSGNGPVSQSQATNRALACIFGDQGRVCPHNKEPGWWERNLKEPVADEIRRQLEAKTRLKIETRYDDQLHMCSICGCCLQLKVNVPIKFIAKHTDAKLLSKYPPHCWQRKELSVL